MLLPTTRLKGPTLCPLYSPQFTHDTPPSQSNNLLSINPTPNSSLSFSTPPPPIHKNLPKPKDQKKKKSMKSILLFCSLLLLSPALLIQIQSSSVGDDDYSCVYMVYIRTGSIFKGGTDSIISLTLSDNRGGTVQISNLEAWGGLMGPGHDYFERGNLDIFSGRGPCLGAPICAMNLTSDGSGPHHGWYCNYVEVTTTGPHVPCSQQLFTVEQWIARDAPPYELTAIRDTCGAAGVQDHQDKNAYDSTI